MKDNPEQLHSASAGTVPKLLQVHRNNSSVL